MLRKPASISNVGLVQFLLASSFVVWLLFFPDRGVDFAWPVVPRQTAMFLGASFIVRAYLGYHLWRQEHWHNLRWQVLGNYGFLAVIYLATFWHVEEMNWFTNIWVAHIWVVAYIVEPVILPLIEPRGAGKNDPYPADLKEGPIFPGVKRIMVGVMLLCATVAGLLIINPAFMDTRWPWALNPFDARIMAAFPTLAGLWAASIYFAEDWAEIKLGIYGLILYAVSLFGMWLVNLPAFNYARKNVWTFGIVVGVFAVLMGYYVWRQSQQKARLAEGQLVAAGD